VPAETAANVFLLAEKTGWKIDYILWEVPLSILCQANHVWMWMNGAKVMRRSSGTSKHKQEIADILGIQI
jgi:hypothetical protein